MNRIYQPSPKSGSNPPAIPNMVRDDAYDKNAWGNNHVFAPSQSAVSRMVEGLATGNIVIVDQQFGNDFTGALGNVNRPYRNHYAAMEAIPAGAPGLCITMPGNYSVNNEFGFPIKDGIDHYLMEATIEMNFGNFSYGIFLIYPDYVKCKIYGKATFKDFSSNVNWALITPYVSCDIEFEGIRFEGAKQIIGQEGSMQQAKKLRFKNCELVSTDSHLPITMGAGNYNAFGDTQAVFEDCFIKGVFIVSSSNAGFFADHYMLKFYRCHFEAIDTNANGHNSNVMFLDYNSSADTAKYLFKDCAFRSNVNNLFCGNGYGGIATNKTIVVDNCRFINGIEGWIVNNNPNYHFKIMNSWSTNVSTGSPVVNLLAGAGIIADANLEIDLYE